MKKQLKNFVGIFLLGTALSACITDQNVDFPKLSQEKGVEVTGKTLSFSDFGFRMDKVHYESSRGLDYFELGSTFNVHLGGVHALSGYPDSFELRKIKKS